MKINQVMLLTVILLFLHGGRMKMVYGDLPPAPYLPEVDEAEEKFSNRELIYLLGDEEYEMRQLAEEKLLKLDPEELILLIKDFEDKDLEIELRLRRIVVKAEQLKFNNQLKLFAEGNHPEVDQEIPYWNEVKKIIPEAEKFRQNYARMIKTDPDFYVVKDNQEEIENVLSFRAYGITSGIETGIAYRPRNFTTLQSMLLLSSINKKLININLGNMLYSLMSTNLGNMLRADNPDQEFSTALVNLWLIHAECVTSYNRLSLGNRFDLPATMIIAREMIKSINDGHQLHYAICSLARLGDDSVIPELIALLKDERVITSRSINSRSKTFDVQVRDLALACLINKTSQNHRDYGFYNIRENTKSLFSAYSTNFTDENARQKAMEMWATWAKDHINEKHEWVNREPVNPMNSETPKAKVSPEPVPAYNR